MQRARRVRRKDLSANKRARPSAGRAVGGAPRPRIAARRTAARPTACARGR